MKLCYFCRFEVDTVEYYEKYEIYGCKECIEKFKKLEAKTVTKCFYCLKNIKKDFGIMFEKDWYVCSIDCLIATQRLKEESAKDEKYDHKRTKEKN